MDYVFWIIPKKLAGRSGPMLEPWDLPAIRDSGITAILSTDSECQAETIHVEGFKHLREYMPTAYPTNPRMVDHFVGMVRKAAVAAMAELNAGGCVLVHCYAGRDRTGLVICALLMELEGIDSGAAVKRLKAVRPQALSGPGVLDVLEEYALRLRSGAF